MAAIEWNVRPGAKNSSISGNPFNEGDRIICLLFATDKPGELGRVDLLASELETFETKGLLLGRWTRVVKNHVDEAREAQRMTEASAESLFFSLFENESPADLAMSEEEHPSSAAALRAILQHFLALLLERRKILKVVGKRLFKGQQTYLHLKEKRHFEVPICDLSAANIAQIQGVIGDLL
jgi:hypothetical protein